MVVEPETTVFREHPGNTRERRGLMFPVPPPHGGHGNTPGSVPGSPMCPVCGMESAYDVVLDRYLHVDGSDDRPCWRALLRGVDLEPLVAHALYRFWAGDELLYVGITLNPASRWPAHARGKAWWEEITAITIERYTSRNRALRAERTAIENEHPKYNVVWNDHPPAAMRDQVAAARAGVAG